MATIKDIAKLTNVSAATVSNVLNGKTSAASPEKSKEIKKTAKELKYQPNSLAKGLKQQHTRTIGIITEDLTVFNTPEIVDGIDEYCGEHNYEIVLVNMRLYKRYDNDFTDTVDHQTLFESIVRTLLAKQIEGIIYVGYHCREISCMPANLDVQIPFVYAYCFPKLPIYPSVLFDDEKAAFEVTKLLIDHGHRKIGIISGPMVSKNAQARLLGVQEALFQGGVLYNTSTTLYGDWSKEQGYEKASVLLQMGVTAIFAFNDKMASGVYQCCMERGLAVGKDLSLAGYDNIDIDECYTPALTSVEAPLNEMGRRSAEIVLAQIHNEPVSNTCLRLPCTLHARASVCLCQHEKAAEEP